MTAAEIAEVLAARYKPPRMTLVETCSAPKPLSPSQSRPVPRRGLSRTEAALYLGVSASKFDELVVDGRMPQPRLIDARKVWDVFELDLAFNELPRQDNPSMTGNSWADR
jgi:predicted DNA-binding transcriptional regulator AlpA